MGDFGCLNLPTSPDPFLDALEYDPTDARRLLVAPFFVLEGLTRELPVAVFLLFPVTIVVRGYFLLPFFGYRRGPVANAEPTIPRPCGIWCEIGGVSY
jgi:hypothetical protein